MRDKMQSDETETQADSYARPAARDEALDIAQVSVEIASLEERWEAAREDARPAALRMLRGLRLAALDALLDASLGMAA